MLIDFAELQGCEEDQLKRLADIFASERKAVMHSEK